MKIHIVFGTTGEYSDRSEWIIKAFKNEDKAKELVTKATEVSNEIFKKYEKKTWECKEKNPYDPDFSMDYTGTSYYYETTELED